MPSSCPVESKTIQILIADDHGVVRKGMRAILERQPGWAVVGEAGNGREVLELVRTHLPDAVVMDRVLVLFQYDCFPAADGYVVIGFNPDSGAGGILR